MLKTVFAKAVNPNDTSNSETLVIGPTRICRTNVMSAVLIRYYLLKMLVNKMKKEKENYL